MIESDNHYSEQQEEICKMCVTEKKNESFNFINVTSSNKDHLYMFHITVYSYDGPDSVWRQETESDFPYLVEPTLNPQNHLSRSHQGDNQTLYCVEFFQQMHLSCVVGDMNPGLDKGPRSSGGHRARWS